MKCGEECEVLGCIRCYALELEKKLSLADTISAMLRQDFRIAEAQVFAARTRLRELTEAFGAFERGETSLLPLGNLFEKAKAHLDGLGDDGVL